MDLKYPILGLIILLLALGIAYAVDGDYPSNLSLTTDRGDYMLGEYVSISVDAPDNVSSSLIIATPSGELLSLMRNESGSFSTRYTPRETGSYATICEFLDLSTTLETNFTVAEAGPEEEVEENATNKTGDDLGDENGTYTPSSNETGELPINETEIPSNETGEPPSNDTEEPPTNETGEVPSNETKELPPEEEIPSNETEEVAPEKPSITINKTEYTVEEEAVIDLYLPGNLSCDLRIITPSGDVLSLMFNRTGSFSTRYSPQEIGSYTATCESLDLSTTFAVSGPLLRAEELREDIMSRLEIRDAKGLSVSTEVGVLLDENELKIVPSEMPIKSIVFRNLNTSGGLNLGLDEIPTGKITEREFVKVYAIDPSGLDFDSATVTVTATGTELYKCADWNFAEQRCGGTWRLFMRGLTPGEEYNFTLTPGDPGFGESITIIDVQSYPTVGGNWTVRFTTNGTANLTITAINGTTWSDSDEDEDLRFLEVRCGEDVLSYDWVGESVFIEDYECNETGYGVSRVLSAGKHTLEFRFGDDVAYAHNWATASCNYARKFTFNNSASSENLANFTVMVKLNSSRIGYAKTSETDIRFYDADDSTLLSHHWELWNESGDSFGWVKVPQIDNTNTDYIWAYYNCTDTATQDESGTYDDNYMMVQHLNETSGTHYDSTSRGNNGTVSGTMSQNEKGKINGADNFTNGYVQFGSSDDFNQNGEVTYDMWVWVRSPVTGNSYHCFMGQDYNDVVWFGMYGTTQKMQVWLDHVCYGACKAGTWPDITLDTWHHVAVTAKTGSGNTKMWIDGTQYGDSITVSTDLVASSTDNMQIGKDVTGYQFQGKIDEARISNISRSESWINASYLSMNDSFITYGAEEEEELSATLVSPPNNHVTSNTAITFNCSATDNKWLENITLYGNWSGGWHANQTKNVSGTSNSTTFTKTVSDGTYIWNCLVYDNDSNSAWGNSNFTFTVDKTPPTLTINSPTGTIADTTPTVNVSFGETVDTAWYNIDNGGNVTLCTNCSSFDTEYLNLAEGSYTIYVFANDSHGNLNDTESSSFTIDMNGNYYDTYDDNSSIAIYNNVSWQRGNVSFSSSGWLYKQAINLTVASGSTPQDYQVELELNSSNVGANFSWSNECINSNSSRVRFMNGSEDTELDFWVESCSVSGENMTVWVEVDQNITTSNYTIYMYYGSSGATAESNGSATFLFFDDFSSQTYYDNYWTYPINDGTDATFTAANGYLEISGGSAPNLATAPSVGLDDYTIDFKFYFIGSLGGAGGGVLRYNNGDWYEQELDEDSLDLYKFTSISSYNQLATTPSPHVANTWYDITFKVGGDSLWAHAKQVDRTISATNDSFTSGVPGVYRWNRDCRFDDYRVRRYSSTEPTHSIGSEEKRSLDGSGNLTSTAINTTKYITGITNITWSEDNTDTNNNITVEVSVDNGQNWYDATNGSGISGFTANNSLVYRVMFATNGTKTVSLLDMNISWGVDTTPPAIDWNWTGVNSTINVDSTTICVNASETVNCTLYFNGTVYVNSTSGTNICWSRTGLANGNYTSVNATCDDLSDNRANTTNAWVRVKTDMWHSFCGNVTGTLVLGNYSWMYNWTWDGEGNVYVYQSDADIDWENLLALGRTIGGAASSDDFEEVDTVLSTVGYINDTNVTYSTDGSAPKETRSFVVHTATVTDVPVVNSTNSSSFVTGILWDASDDGGDNEFDATDNEDLVFVVKINSTASNGICWDVDYEIRVPDTLDTYKGSSGTVDFVVELSI